MTDLKTIYADAEREISVDVIQGIAVVRSITRGAQVQVPLRTLDSLDARTAAMVREAGKSPADYRQAAVSGVVVVRAAWPAWDAAVAECEAQREARAKAAAEWSARPENAERERIRIMFDDAERLRDYPGDYFPAVAEAQRALAVWQAQYPEAAKEERRQSILAAAAHERELASGALSYDADGWLDADARRKNSDEHTAKAEAFEAEAKAL